MKFETFNQLARGNRSTLLLAMEVLMQSGREFILRMEKAELVSTLKENAGKLIAETMLAEVVEVSKELSRLRTCELLDYVKRSDLEFERPDAPEPGVCPICGTEVEYQDTALFEDEDLTNWKCPDCGAVGKEVYKKEFQRHMDVLDGDGKPFLPSAKQDNSNKA